MPFPLAFPPNCPPDRSGPTEATIYRALETAPPAAADFLSWVEAQHQSANRNICKHWGLSVWLDEEAVEHARGTIPSMREKYIASAQLADTDGRVAATPSRTQPLHCTFWCDEGAQIFTKFSVYLEPELDSE
jgi:hypothetical protein